MADLSHFTRADADRVLRRAAELEGRGDSGPLSIAELRSIALEAGFGAPAVERAITEARQSARPHVQNYPVQRSGLVISQLSTIRVIPIELTTAQLMQAIRLSQPYRDGPAQVRLEEERIVWRDRKGIVTTVTSANGETEIRVSVSKILLRRGRWMGWVKAAADRLEGLVLLLDTRPALGPGEPPV